MDIYPDWLGAQGMQVSLQKVKDLQLSVTPVKRYSLKLQQKKVQLQVAKIRKLNLHLTKKT